MKKAKYISTALVLLGLLFIIVALGYITFEIHWIFFVLYIGILFLLLGSLIYKENEEETDED